LHSDGKSHQADPPAPAEDSFENRDKPLDANGAGGQAGTGGGAGSGGDVGSGGWVLQTLAALGLVIGLILLGRWLWIKLSGQVPTRTSGSRAVEVLSRTAVAPKNHVLLLRVGERILIVGDSSQGLQTLAQVDEPDEVAELLTAVTSQNEHSVSGQFRQVMSRVSGRFDATAAAAEDGRDEGEHHLDRSRAAVSSLMSRVRHIANRGGAS
jgi:flagellar biogenesis protein FliO